MYYSATGTFYSPLSIRKRGKQDLISFGVTLFFFLFSVLGMKYIRVICDGAELGLPVAFLLFICTFLTSLMLYFDNLFGYRADCEKNMTEEEIINMYIDLSLANASYIWRRQGPQPRTELFIPEEVKQEIVDYIWEQRRTGKLLFASERNKEYISVYREPFYNEVILRKHGAKI